MTAATMLRRIRFAPLVIAVAAGFMSVTVLAAGETIQPTSATLLARGAAVAVGVTYTCAPGDTIGNFGMEGVSVAVQQAVSKTSQASGTAFAEPTAPCTGSPQSFTVTVPAMVPGPPFRTGPALITANLSGADSSGAFFFATSGPVVLKISK